jgi:hypothetical protein
MGGLKFSPKPTKYGQLLFYEAVKVDMADSKETSFNNTITSILSMITGYLNIYLKPSPYTRKPVVKR